jgi:hypothetical protein
LETTFVSIQINIGDHVSPFAFFKPVPFRHQFATKWARTRAKEIAANVKTADKYFKSLSGKRSLTQLLADRRIWINYTELPVAGMRPGGSNEIGIGASTYLRGRMIVLGTLIHELAHIAGAPDGKSRAAEDALIHCGLGKQSEADSNIDDPSTPYEPRITG